MKKNILLFLITAYILCFVFSCKFNGKEINLDTEKSPFKTLSEYHFFKDKITDLLPNEGIISYDLISPLFTDYAFKKRFVYVPKGAQIDFQDTAVLNLPVGSCYIKNFYYPVDFRKPTGNKKIIETRLLVHRKAGWEGLDYIWNEAQTDAVLEIAGDIKKVNWIHYDGTAKEISYVIPNKNQCKGCHWNNGIGILPIGPRARNLNHDFAYEEGSCNQLEKWNKADILKNFKDSKTCSKMVAVDDSTASLDLRARSYLDINCAHCHNENGPAYTSGLYLNYESQDLEHLGVCKSPVAAGKGTGGFLVDISPKDPAHSILAFRMESTDAGVRMPEVGRTLVHKEGLELIQKWIQNMNGGCK